MSDFDLSDLEDDDLLAAEYVLGVLDSVERRHTERRLRNDPAFAAAVGGWETRLAPMMSSIAPAAVPADLWGEIDADLTRMRRMQPAAVPQAVRRPGGLVSSVWRWFGIGSFGLMVASLATLVVIVSQPPQDSAPLAASIAGEGGVPLYTAVVYPGSSSATLVPVSVSADPAHAHELWLIGAEGVPQSLGVLAPSAGGALRIEIGPELLSGGGLLAISLEPPGGSPTGQPTGPVVAKGELHDI